MNSSSEEDFSKEVVVYTKIVLYCVILVWSFCGNVLVIAVIFKNNCLRTNFNYLIVNMAVSDLAIPCLAIPLKIADSVLRSGEWLIDGDLGQFLCKTCYFVSDVSNAVSGFSLVIIAVNRFLAIAFPMRSRLSKRRTLKLIAATWILALLLLSPHLYTFRLEKNAEWTMCVSRWSPAFDDVTAEIIFIAILTAFVFIIPCLTNTILYAVMLCKLRQNSTNMITMLNNQQYKRRQRKDKNIFIMTVVIMFLYLILWGPFFITLIILSFFVHQNNDNVYTIQTAIVTVQFLGYLNSAVNPCIYFYFLKNLRQGLKRLFGKSPIQSPQESLQMTILRSRASTLRPQRSLGKTESDVLCTKTNIN